MQTLHRGLCSRKSPQWPNTPTQATSSNQCSKEIGLLRTWEERKRKAVLFLVRVLAIMCYSHGCWAPSPHSCLKAMIVPGYNGYCNTSGKKVHVNSHFLSQQLLQKGRDGGLRREDSCMIKTIVFTWYQVSVHHHIVWLLCNSSFTLCPRLKASSSPMFLFKFVLI